MLLSALKQIDAVSWVSIGNRRRRTGSAGGRQAHVKGRAASSAAADSAAGAIRAPYWGSDALREETPLASTQAGGAHVQVR